MTTRTTHDRLNDHFGEDHDTNIVLDGATSSYDDGASLHDVLLDLDDRVSAAVTSVGQTGTVNFILDGTTGVKGDIELGFAGVWTAVRLFATAGGSGSMVVDIWKDTYANYPPTGGDSITASAKPTISSGTKSQDTTLTGWTTTFSAGDILRINTDSVSTITQATLSLTFRRPTETTQPLYDTLTLDSVTTRTGSFHRTLTDHLTTWDAAFKNAHVAGDGLSISDSATAVVT